MPELEFLKTPDQHYLDHRDMWAREERRLFGDDEVLEELSPFVSEPTDSIDHRKRTARYMNFPDLHTTVLSGHLRRAMPLPSMGPFMGPIRTRKEIDVPTKAEVAWYNIDGLGLDGSQLPAFVDGVEKAAMATGERWVLVDMPTLEDLVAIRIGLGRSPDDPDLRSLVVTDVEKANGWHPFFVHVSPLQVPRARYEKGVLKYAVMNIKLPQDRVADDAGVLQGDADGFYVFVRAGYEGIGTRFRRGGWWIFNADHQEVVSAPWELTRGQIPLVRVIGDASQGTTLRPGVARSLTMMLGQIAIDLMNARSEQRHNARTAAVAANWLLNAGKDVHKEVAPQAAAHSILIAVPPHKNADGTFTPVTLWNSSAAALQTSVYTSIITEAIEEARELMVKQVTSTPNSSGESKKAGFEEATQPLLTRLAANLETWVTTALTFYAMRSGDPNPTATLQMPRAFDLRRVVDDIDNMLGSLRTAGLRSDDWVIELLLKKGEELGLVTDDNRPTIEAQLRDAAQQKRDQAAQAKAALDQLTPPIPDPATPPEPPVLAAAAA